MIWQSNNTLSDTTRNVSITRPRVLLSSARIQLCASPHIGTRGNPDHAFVLQTFQCALERHVEWDAFVAFCDRYSKMGEVEREEVHLWLSEALRWNDVDRVVGLFVGG